MSKDNNDSFFTEEERKMLEPKYYPYEDEARRFFDYYVGFPTNNELDKHLILQKRMLADFGRFIEKAEVPIPVKKDAIQFLFVERNNYSLCELITGLEIIDEFIKYCEKNVDTICERAFEEKDVSRKVRFKCDQIPYSSTSTIKDKIHTFKGLKVKYKKLTKGGK